MEEKEKKKRFAAKLSVISNTFLTVAKLITGIFTGSIGILSEAIHSGIDLAASLVAYFSIRAASVPADDDHPYGHGKYEDLSGLVEAVLIFVAVVIILYEVIDKLINNQSLVIQTELAIVVMIIAVIINIFVSQYLFKVAKETDSIALYADAQHLNTDVLTSLGVLISLIIIKFTGFYWVDPVAAILIVLFISVVAFKIAKKAIGNLLDEALPKEEEDTIKKILDKYSDEIISVHKFRSRKAGANRFIDFHLIIEGDITIKHGHILCDCIEEDIKQVMPTAFISIHLEPCTEDCEDCHVYIREPDSCKKLVEKIRSKSKD